MAENKTEKPLNKKTFQKFHSSAKKFRDDIGIRIPNTAFYQQITVIQYETSLN